MRKSLTFDLLSMLLGILFLLGYKILNFLEVYPILTYPLQAITTGIVYIFQRLFGAEIAVYGFNLVYENGLSVLISSICVGIEQLIFFWLMLSFFVGIDFRKKVRGFLSFAPIILLFNLFRLLMLYPLSVFYGVTFAWAVHDFLFIYGQGIFLLGLIVLWYFSVRKINK